MPKLKERQFYNIVTGKYETIKEELIRIVKFKNGSYSLIATSKKIETLKMFKLISESKLEKMEKKYGKAKKYIKSKSK